MAQRFRTDLVDEIVQGGIKFWRAVTASGSILLDSFKMERTNTNTQEGSAFGAKEANAIHEFLNGVLDGTETVNKATNASKLPDLGYGAKMPLSSDTLSIALDRSKNGLIEQVNSYSASTANTPVANFIGTKTQYVIEGSWAIVVLHEMYPISGRIWMNCYNQTWRGWVPFSTDDTVVDKTVSEINKMGLSLGSPSMPNRPLNFYSSDGTRYQLHSNSGNFWIHRFNSKNQVINSPLTIQDGVCTVDNAGSAPWSTLTGKPFTELGFIRGSATFINGTTLRFRIGVGSVWRNCKVFISNQYAYGTAVHNVQTMFGYVDESGVLNVDCHGSFVAGHILSIDVMLAR